MGKQNHSFMKTKLLEVCCYSLQSAINAEQAGANRIELCAGIYEGGTTPSAATIAMAKQQLSIPINVIIRPRGADFCYSDREMDCILADIEYCKKIGVAGIVSGVLNANGTIDIERTKQLIDAARPLSFTFHRAFDMVENQQKALHQLIDLGVDRILTSGGMATAELGAEQLAKLVQNAEDKIIVMPGSGINGKNIARLKEITNAKEFHCSAKTLVDCATQYKNPNISMGGDGTIPEFAYFETDKNEVRNIVSQLSEL